jgi:threonine/homoserine/homoserine lactone efflux protein
MKALELLIRGLLAGLISAAPVGPVNVLCISRPIRKGWKSGLISGLGAATADFLYGCVAGFSITFVIQFLTKEEFWIRMVGGILLVLIGAWYYFKQPESLSKHESGEAERSDYASTFLLTLTNPTTVFSFMAVLASLGLGGEKTSWITLFLVLGIFSGSMLWWIALTAIVNRFRDRFHDRTMLLMNRIAGLAIGGFGVLAFLLSGAHRR